MALLITYWNLLEAKQSSEFPPFYITTINFPLGCVFLSSYGFQLLQGSLIKEGATKFDHIICTGDIDILIIMIKC